MTMSKQRERVFDIFNLKKPKPDNLTGLNKPKLKSISDNDDSDSVNVDSDLLASFSYSCSKSCLNATDNKSTSTNLLKNEKIIDLGDLKTGPIRPVLKVIIIII